MKTSVPVGTPATQEWVKERVTEWVTAYVDKRLDERLSITEQRFDDRVTRMEERIDRRFDQLQELVGMVVESQITMIQVVSQIDQRVTKLERFGRNGNGRPQEEDE